MVVIACGALGGPIREIAARRGWDLEVHALPPLLHNRPRAIAPSAEALARRLQAEGRRVVLAYADCGSYGALDELCSRLGVTQKVPSPRRKLILPPLAEVNRARQ